MVIVRTIEECRQARHKLADVCLVPTMGALHAGHASLLHAARKHATHTAVSIFVNPTQFGPREDYTKYPRTKDADLALCKEARVDLVFMPEAADIYPPGSPKVTIDLPELTTILEGKHRPGHFDGVCQVVAKLFHIIQPQTAVFGRKDFQQLRVIQAMVEALDFPIAVVGLPTLRDADGLALSSRNRYLSPDERQRALSISRALKLATQEVAGGVRQANRLVATMQSALLDPGKLGRVPLSIDYVACVDPLTLKPVDQLEGEAVLAIAARVGATRLIDNTPINA